MSTLKAKVLLEGWMKGGNMLDMEDVRCGNVDER